MDVSSCAYVVTIGGSLHASAVPPGYAIAIPDGSNSGGVIVSTFDAAGSPAQEGFHLVVNCTAPRSGCATWAAVNSDSTLADTGCAGATVVSEGTGTYVVLFRTSVVNCAFTATVGDNASASDDAPSPATITVSGANGQPKGVFIETSNGGGNVAEPFFVNVVC